MEVKPAEAVRSRLRGSWEALRASLPAGHEQEARLVVAPGSELMFTSSCSGKGFSGPANQSQEGAPSSGSPPSMHWEGALEWAGGSSPLSIPSIHQPGPSCSQGAPHPLACLEGHPFAASFFASVRMLSQPTVGLSPSHPNYLLSPHLGTGTLLGVRKAPFQGRMGQLI